MLYKIVLKCDNAIGFSCFYGSWEISLCKLTKWKKKHMNLHTYKTIQRNKQKRYLMSNSLCLLKEISKPMKMTKQITTFNLWTKRRWFSWIPNPTFQIWLPNMLYILLKHQVTFSWETKLVDNYIIYFSFWTTKKIFIWNNNTQKLKYRFFKTSKKIIMNIIHPSQKSVQKWY